jgi:hypothetical protein
MATDLKTLKKNYDTRKSEIHKLLKGGDTKEVYKSKEFLDSRILYRKTRNAYTDGLKAELTKMIASKSSNSEKEKAREDYLTKRIEITDFDTENLEDDINEQKSTQSMYLIFDSSLGKGKSQLLTLYPFQRTEQEENESTKESGKNYYDLFVKYAEKPADGNRPVKQGVYTNILGEKETENTFEKQKADTTFDYGTGSFLSPFALYKLWLSESNSYPLLKKLLSFLPPNDVNEFEELLIAQFETYDTTKREELETLTGKSSEESGRGKGKPSTTSASSYRTRSKTGSLTPLIAGQAIGSRGGSGGGRHRITPRLKREGRKTKRRSK